jgi:hypothetical protein
VTLENMGEEIKKESAEIKSIKLTHGGRRPGAGRKKKIRPTETEKIIAKTKGKNDGARRGAGRLKANKVTAEVMELARQYGPGAIAELARLATQAESEAARVAAIKELLDRGYGRAVQPIEGTMKYGVSEQLAELLRENASGTLGSEIARRALPAPNVEHEQELH